MKKILIGLGSIALALAIFAGGVYANEQGWLSFTGGSNIENSQADVDRIMEILKQLDEEKTTINEAYEELLEMNPSGLAKQNKELRKQVKELEGQISNLNTEKEDLIIERDNLQTELSSANTNNEDLRNEIATLNENISNLNKEIDGLNADKTELQGTIELRDHTIIGLDEEIDRLNNELANAPEDQAEYVNHLEEELKRANQAAETIKSHTGQAVEEAEALVGED